MADEESRVLLKLQEPYEIHVDTYNFILVQRRVRLKGKFKGEVYAHHMGFYGSLVAVLMAAVSKGMLEGGEADNVEALITRLDEWARKIVSIVEGTPMPTITTSSSGRKVIGAPKPVASAGRYGPGAPTPHMAKASQKKRRKPRPL